MNKEISPFDVAPEAHHPELADLLPSELADPSLAEQLAEQYDEEELATLVAEGERVMQRRTFAEAIINGQYNAKAERRYTSEELKRKSGYSGHEKGKRKPRTHFALSRTATPICALLDQVLDWFTPIVNTAAKQPLVQHIVKRALDALLFADDAAARASHTSSVDVKASEIGEMIYHLDIFHRCIVKLSTCVRPNGKAVVSEHRMAVLAPKWAQLTEQVSRWCKKYDHAAATAAPTTATDTSRA